MGIMVDRIEGDSSISPQSKALYKQEFERAVGLFQQSLAAYENSQIPEQKDKYKDVMNRALQIIHETIKEALSKEGQKKGVQLDNDYQAFLNNDNPQTYQKLNKDLDLLRGR